LIQEVTKPGRQEHDAISEGDDEEERPYSPCPTFKSSRPQALKEASPALESRFKKKIPAKKMRDLLRAERRSTFLVFKSSA